MYMQRTSPFRAVSDSRWKNGGKVRAWNGEDEDKFWMESVEVVG